MHSNLKASEEVVEFHATLAYGIRRLRSDEKEKLKVRINPKQSEQHERRYYLPVEESETLCL